MAWVFENEIIFGEIDNRTEGQISGTLIFAGCPNPISFKLKGNCQADLAGRCLVFFNPYAQSSQKNFPSIHQKGCAGFVTAKHKIQVSDEAPHFNHDQNQGRWHWENGIILEWFNKTEGRVYIELINCQAQISEPHWSLSKELRSTQDKQIEKLNLNFMENIVDDQDLPLSEQDELIQNIKSLRKVLGCSEVEVHDKSMLELRDELQYLKGLMKYEGINLCSSVPPAADPPFPLTIPPWDDISPQNLNFELWRLIYGLAGSAIFITMTEHLEDKRLYQLLIDEIIKSKKFSFRVGGGGWNHHFSIIDFADDLENLDDELTGRHPETKSNIIIFLPSQRASLVERDNYLPNLHYK